MIPRPEYPRPQLVRQRWLNLNGEWEFEIDQAGSGLERGFEKRSELSGKIVVPFCPESKLSGIGHSDFMQGVWYRREFEIPKDWAGKRVLLHFGAVDYHTVVWVNAGRAGEHRGGYSSFCFDITEYLREGANVVTVYARDDVRSRNQPAGKQSAKYESYGCYYTRTTGIWQTVWLECVNACHIKSLKYIPSVATSSLFVEAVLSQPREGLQLSAAAAWKGEEVGTKTAKVCGCVASVEIPLSELHLWDVGQGNLYDLKMELRDTEGILDEITSYFGMRSIALDDGYFILNGRTVFGRFVLDQGYYPDGIYTAPSDAALRRDIELSMELGFNGARLHEKMFEPRFLYWADKMGYLVWGEHANWGLNISTADGLSNFLPEWIEGVQRDFNHPSIIGWCPFNETWDEADGSRQLDSVIETTYRITKALDPTRPVIDTSGHFHVVSDIFDVHDYEQDVEKFRENYAHIGEGIVNDHVARNPFICERQSYSGGAVFVSEYGGIRWNSDDSTGWGYGDAPATEEEFLERYKGLTESLLQNPRISAFCYTQLYDVEQEVNGLCTYEREFKFEPALIRQVNRQKAAIEK